MTDHLPKGWTRKRIDELGQLYSGSTPSTHVVAYWGDEIVWVTPNDLSKLRTRYITNSERRITEVGLRNCSAHLLPKGSLIISSRAPIGYLAIAQTDFCTNQGCKSLVFSSEQDPDFHYYNLSFRVKSIKEKGEGTTFAEISKSALAKIEVPVPVEKAEQTAIADILSTVDEAIAQTEALIAKQRRIKAGLLHDLLTRGIDEHGQLRDPATHRFKQTAVGLVPEEWEVKQLHQCLSFISYGFTNPMPETTTGPYLVTAANILDGHIDYDSCRHTSIDAFNQLLTSKSRPIANDILLTKDGTLGRLALANGTKICINQSVAILRTNGQVEPKFLKMLLESPVYQAKLLEDSGGSTIKHLYISRIGKLPIAVPASILERKRLRELVADETAVIESEVKQLAKLRLLKTGLMQDLLSGRVSVARLMPG